jgi:hypothetical protein
VQSTSDEVSIFTSALASAFVVMQSGGPCTVLPQ